MIDEAKYYYDGKDCLHYSADDLRKIQDEIFPVAFAYHYNSNEQYKQYCDMLNIKPEDVRSSSDIYKIPLIPSVIFKQREVYNGRMESIEKVCTSSGTKGSISKVFRDKKTIDRFVDSIEITLKYVIGTKEKSLFIILGPRPKESKDLWIAYAMSQINRIYPVEHYVTDGKPDFAGVVSCIEAQKDVYDQIVILGAPVMLLMLADYLLENKVEFGESGKYTFITAGGWKRFKSRQLLPKELQERVVNNFTGCTEDNFFDVYNSVELNSCVSECPYHYKHTMPWTRIIAIDPVTGKPMPEGETGLLAVYDASSLSYPCFILTDDYGRVLFDGSCECGRTGQGVEFIRRVETVESRGCALKMDKQYSR